MLSSMVLAASFSAVTGYSVTRGLASASETLCGQVSHSQLSGVPPRHPSCSPWPPTYQGSGVLGVVLWQ